jgi:hypothetical protein
MSCRLGHPAFRVWKRLGYRLTDPLAAIPCRIAGIVAEAPGCAGYRLKLIVDDGTICVISLEKAPVKPKRLWQEVPELRDYEGWDRVPAAWFGRTVESLLAVREASKADGVRAAHAVR